MNFVIDRQKADIITDCIGHRNTPTFMIRARMRSAGKVERVKQFQHKISAPKMLLWRVAHTGFFTLAKASRHEYS